MAAGELHSGRIFLQIHDRQIVVRIGIGGIEFHGAAEFGLGTVDPSAFSLDNA